jgi:hypothetical protein
MRKWFSWEWVYLRIHNKEFQQTLESHHGGQYLSRGTVSFAYE